MTNMEKLENSVISKPNKEDLLITLYTFSYFENHFNSDNYSNLSNCYYNVARYIARYSKKNYGLDFTFNRP